MKWELHSPSTKWSRYCVLLMPASPAIHEQAWSCISMTPRWQTMHWLSSMQDCCRQHVIMLYICIILWKSTCFIIVTSSSSTWHHTKYNIYSKTSQYWTLWCTLCCPLNRGDLCWKVYLSSICACHVLHLIRGVLYLECPLMEVLL